MRLCEFHKPKEFKYDVWVGRQVAVREPFRKERQYLAKGVSYDEAERMAEKEIFKRKLAASHGDWEINGLEVHDPIGPGKEQERTGDSGISTTWGLEYDVEDKNRNDTYLILTIVPHKWKGFD
jgi:hypothetical protein